MSQAALKLGVMYTVAPTHPVDLIAAGQSPYKGIELQLFAPSRQKEYDGYR